METDTRPNQAAPSIRRPAVVTPAHAPAIRADGWYENLGGVGILKLILLAIVLFWFYHDHLKRMMNVWQQPDWSHGFIVPLFSIYLIHQNRARLFGTAGQGSLWGLALLVMSLLIYSAAVFTKFGYPQPLTIVFVLAGLVLLNFGWRALKITWFPLMFLFLAIPPPERLYRELTQPLQQFAALIAKYVLTLFPGVYEIQRAGFSIAYYMDDGRNGTFTVAGACSGMRSLMAFVAIGLAMAYLTHRPTWHRIALAGCVIPVALFCNIARVIITGSLQMYGKGNLATGTPHTVLGLVMFGLGFLVYMGLIWILDHLFVEDRADGSAALREDAA